MDGFETVKNLAPGAFGAFSLLRNKSTNELIVQKHISIKSLTQKGKETTINQVYVLDELIQSPHPNLIGGEGYIQINENLYIYLEHGDRGSLLTEINSKKDMNEFFDENTILDYLSQMAAGLDHLHQLSIIHCDIKPQNVVIVSPQTLKLGDFGSSRILNAHGGVGEETVEVPSYVAPEIWERQRYDYRCDIWSLGAVVYELAELRPPFWGDTPLIMVDMVLKEDFAPLNERWSQLVQQLVKMMLIKDPKMRPHAHEVAKYILDGQVPDFTLEEQNSDDSVRAVYSEQTAQSPPQSDWGVDFSAVEDETYLVDVFGEVVGRGCYGHVMISYSYDDTDQVVHVKTLLENLQYPIWLDHNDTNIDQCDSVVKAVEEASVVLVCYSEKYMTCRSCRLEAKYAHQTGKPMVFLRMQVDFEPGGWLGIVMADAVEIDFSGKQCLEESNEYLIKCLKELMPVSDDVGSIEPIEEEEEEETLAAPELNATAFFRQIADDDTVQSSSAAASVATSTLQLESMVQSPAPASIASMPQLESIATASGYRQRIPYRDWHQSEVAEWFNENGLELHAEKFSYLDGRLLQQMVIWNQTDPTSLRAQLSGAGLDFEASLRMTAALHSLAEQNIRQVAQSITCSLM